MKIEIPVPITCDSFNRSCFGRGHHEYEPVHLWIKIWILLKNPSLVLKP